MDDRVRLIRFNKDTYSVSLKIQELWSRVLTDFRNISKSTEGQRGCITANSLLSWERAGSVGYISYHMFPEPTISLVPSLGTYDLIQKLC